MEDGFKRRKKKPTDRSKLLQSSVVRYPEMKRLSCVVASAESSEENHCCQQVAHNSSSTSGCGAAGPWGLMFSPNRPDVAVLEDPGALPRTSLIVPVIPSSVLIWVGVSLVSDTLALCFLSGLPKESPFNVLDWAVSPGAALVFGGVLARCDDAGGVPPDAGVAVELVLLLSIGSDEC